MTLTGWAIVAFCFFGPLLPPIIGTIVGNLHDVVIRRQHEGLDLTARRLVAEREAVAASGSTSTSGALAA